VLQVNRKAVDLPLPAQAVLSPQLLLVPQPVAQIVLGNAQRIADRRDIAIHPVNLVERVDLLVQDVTTVHPHLLACRRQ